MIYPIIFTHSPMRVSVDLRLERIRLTFTKVTAGVGDDTGYLCFKVRIAV